MDLALANFACTFQTPNVGSILIAYISGMTRLGVIWFEWRAYLKKTNVWHTKGIVRWSLPGDVDLHKQSCLSDIQVGGGGTQC